PGGIGVEIVDAERHRADMEAAIARHSSQPVTLEIVDDVREWCDERGMAHDGTYPVAMAVVQNDRRLIVVRPWIDKHSARGVLGRIERSRPDARTLLSTPELFMRHLALHELAHHENGWHGQGHEDRCDAWAFDRLHAGE